MKIYKLIRILAVSGLLSSAYAGYTPGYLTSESTTLDQDTSLTNNKSAASDFSNYITSLGMSVDASYTPYYNRMIQAMPDFIALMLGATVKVGNTSGDAQLQTVVQSMLSYVHTKQTADGIKANNFSTVVKNYFVSKMPTTATSDMPATQADVTALLLGNSNIGTKLSSISYSSFKNDFLTSLKANGTLNIVGILNYGDKIQKFLSDNNITGNSSTSLVSGIKEFCSAIAVLNYSVLNNDDNTFNIINAVRSALSKTTGASSNIGNMSSDVKTSIEAALLVADGNSKITANGTFDQTIKNLMGAISDPSSTVVSSTPVSSADLSSSLKTTLGLASSTSGSTTTYNVTYINSTGNSVTAAIDLDAITSKLGITNSDDLNKVTSSELVALNTIATATTYGSTDLSSAVTSLIDMISNGTVSYGILNKAVNTLISIAFTNNGTSGKIIEGVTSGAVGTTGDSTMDAIGSLVLNNPSALAGITSDTVNTQQLASAVSGQMSEDQRNTLDTLNAVTGYVTDSGTLTSFAHAFGDAL